MNSKPNIFIGKFIQEDEVGKDIIITHSHEIILMKILKIVLIIAIAYHCLKKCTEFSAKIKREMRSLFH